ncbi:MAG: hypothetical protein P4M09_10995 [Devosia sp.]|nr:hypothetical protein [Devosia sp.]
MWFGHGTGPGKDEDSGDDGGDLFGPAEIGERIAAVAQGAIGALPAELRARAAARNDPATLEALTAVMTAWARAGGLDHAEFAERFLGRSAEDPVAGDLRATAMGAETAKSHADLAETAGHLTDAMRAIGIDRWQSFVADAAERAKDPATLAVVADNRQSQARDGNPADAMAYAKSPSLSELMKRDDSIRPVYPVETALGIAATGVAAGGVAAVRAAAGAVLRQVAPKIGPPGGATAGDSTAGATSTEEPTSPGAEGSETIELTEPSFPADPDELLKESWEETSHPKAAAKGRRTFVDSKTGQTVEFDKAQSGKTGWKGQDHYHVKNPNTTGTRDKYLDKNGHQVPDQSKSSHIPPNR